MATELGRLGHHVIAIECAETLNEDLAHKSTDLMIIDANLPGEDGFSLVKRMRKIQPNIGIIMLTARTSAQDRISGYESGADIYLTKPISLPELSAAVSGLSRRVLAFDNIENQMNAVPYLEINTATLKIKGPLGESTLTTAEFSVLLALARTPGHQLDYWQLFDVLGKDCDSNAQRLLEVQISRIRVKLCSLGANENSIRSIRLKGYQLCFPIRIL